jgi:NCS1 family nucleobase:cation symporter-1
VLTPLYGILVADYYLVKKQKLDIQQLFSSNPSGLYYYDKGWNSKALIAFGIAAVFSISTVWVPALSALAGFGWLIGAALGGAIHVALMRSHPVMATA